MKTRIILLCCIFLNMYQIISAQAYYMHEAAEDNDGGPFSGITGLLLIIGIGYILDKLGRKEND